MDWNKKPRSISAMRLAGIILLGFGIFALAAGIVLTVTFGTVLAPVLLGGSIFINTAAVICLRHK